MQRAVSGSPCRQTLARYLGQRVSLRLAGSAGQDAENQDGSAEQRVKAEGNYGEGWILDQGDVLPDPRASRRARLVKTGKTGVDLRFPDRSELPGPAIEEGIGVQALDTVAAGRSWKR